MSAPWWADVAGPLADWLAHVTIGGIVLSGLALLLGSLLPRAAATARVAVWRAGVVALLVLPIASVALPWEWTAPGMVRQLAPNAWKHLATEPRDDRPAGSVAASSTGDAGGTAGPVESRPTAPAAAPAVDAARWGATHVQEGWLILIWAAVVTAILIRFGAGLLALRLHARRARDVSGRIAELAVDAPLGARIRVLEGGPFRTPGCWGLRTPTILLPHGSEGWSGERLRAVLLHEAAHLIRSDPLFLALSQCACALHWPNPLVWLLQRQLLADGEAAADAAVIGAGVQRRSYVQLLVDIADEARANRAQPALGIARPGRLSRRVSVILQGGVAAPATRWMSAAMCLLLVSASVASATIAAANASGTPPPSASGDGGFESVGTRKADGAAAAIHPDVLTSQAAEECPLGLARVGGRFRYCRVQSLELSRGMPIVAHVRTNGAVRVGKNEYEDRARLDVWVEAWADDADAARRLASAVSVAADPEIRISGPDTPDPNAWGVTLELFVPDGAALDLSTTNGGIAVRNVGGRMRLRTENGSISVVDASGSIDGHAVNGSLYVDLAGERWQGEKLDLRTDNGAVSVAVPVDYAGTLDVGTLNGAVDAAVLAGRFAPGQPSAGDSDGAGPLVRVRTRNGAVSIREEVQ